MLNIDDLFKGRHFERDHRACVRHYLRYKLSFPDLVEMMAERGLSPAHTTIIPWIQRYAVRSDYFKRLEDRISHRLPSDARREPSLAAR
jgi:transposase-like protein